MLNSPITPQMRSIERNLIPFEQSTPLPAASSLVTVTHNLEVKEVEEETHGEAIEVALNISNRMPIMKNMQGHLRIIDLNL